MDDHNLNEEQFNKWKQLCKFGLQVDKKQKMLWNYPVELRKKNFGHYELEVDKKIIWDGIILATKANLFKKFNIPEDIDYDSFSGLSNEVKSKFKKMRPKTMGQALRIDGVTPAAVYILLSHLKRKSIKHIA